jgi:hypothetical protein
MVSRPNTKRHNTLQRSRSYKLHSISNNVGFHLKHPGVPDGSDGSDRTSYSLTENFMTSVAQAMGRVAYLPPLLCTWCTHYRNDTCVILYAGAADML